MTTNFVTESNKNYPKELKKIPDPPKELFYKGDLSQNIFKNCLAVVGSRRMTIYGKEAVFKIVYDLALSGITIVSGFMYGIDATAHKVALKAKGKTVAVMPCGIDNIHPAYQKDLYNKIIKNKGIILSELKGNKAPQKWSYPKRNRIVAGISSAVLVVEATENSGSLITANCAKKFGKKIFAIPGPITSSTSVGTNNLIKEGATLVRNSKDILDFYKLNQQKFNFSLKEKPTDNKKHEQIIKILKAEPLEIDEIARKVSLSSSQTAIIISEMEIIGLIKKENSKYYIL